MKVLDIDGLEYYDGLIKGFIGDNYLPLLGGTMTGLIFWINGDKAAKFNSNNKLVFPDGTTLWVENITES